MCKAIADRMLAYLPRSPRLRTESQLIYWERFYRSTADGYVAMALDAEKANMSPEYQEDFLDYAMGCELAANILSSRLCKL